MKSVILASCLACAFPFAATPATYVVSPDGTGDFPTIQSAIDAASDGDVIELLDGVFLGNGNRDIDYLGKAITIRSLSGDAAACIIDCEGSEVNPHRGVVFRSGEGAASVLDGITITGGVAAGSGPGAHGGGVLCLDGAAPSIVGCRFTGNVTGQFGGGLCAIDSAPTITSCRFEMNSASRGGGVACFEWSDCELDGCVFVENESALGGGFYCGLGGSATVVDCQYDGNGASEGGGAYVGGEGAAHAAFVSCAFRSNVASVRGGGVLLTSDLLNGCTLYANAAPCGGGVCVIGDHSPNVMSTIIAFSSAGEALHFEYPNFVFITCCDFYGNAGGDWVGAAGDQHGLRGNFAGDPMFCDAGAGDLRLAANSPCLPNNHPQGYDCGLIGAFGAGCEAIGVDVMESAEIVPRLVVSWNPFRDSVGLTVRTDDHDATVIVFDVSGRKLDSFHVRPPGGRVTWNAGAGAGGRAASGTYFVQLSTGTVRETRRVVLLQ